MINLINISCSSCDSLLEIVFFELREAANSLLLPFKGKVVSLLGCFKCSVVRQE